MLTVVMSVCEWGMAVQKSCTFIHNYVTVISKNNLNPTQPLTFKCNFSHNYVTAIL